MLKTRLFLVAIVLATVFGSPNYRAFGDTATTGDGRVIENPTSNGDLKLRVNVGGVRTDAMTISGSTGLARFPVGMSANGNWRGSEGGTTVGLTSADNRVQHFTPSAAKTVQMPTTGITAGDMWTITVVTTATNALAVQSSGGNNIYFLRNNAELVLVATQAAPTTAAHWRVVHYLETGSFVHDTINWTCSVVPTGLTESAVYTRTRSQLIIGGSARYSTAGTACNRVEFQLPFWLDPESVGALYSWALSGGLGTVDSGSYLPADGFGVSNAGNVLMDIATQASKKASYSIIVNTTTIN